MVFSHYGNLAVFTANMLQQSKKPENQEKHQQTDHIMLLYSNTHQHEIYRRTGSPGSCTAGIHGRLGDYRPKGALINITPCGSLNNYLNENSSLQNVLYITLSFPKKTHYWERKSPHVCTVLMKYDSSLSPHDGILTLNRWSLLFFSYMYGLHNILSNLSQLTDVPEEKKFILLTETTRHWST